VPILPCLRGLPARWTIDSNSAARTAHRALGKDAPLGWAVERSGVIVAIPILSGLHNQYVRI
jgi:hypothetical protein